MTATLVVLALLGACVEGTPYRNTTIPHSPNEICKDTNFYDLGVFFIGNYIAHAATVKSYPGESTASGLIATIGALLIPTSGLIRGLNSILRNAKFTRKGLSTALLKDSDYDTAAASGGLCMVVRKKSWKPCRGDKVSDVMLREQSREIPATSNWRRRHRAWERKHKAKVFYKLEPVPHGPHNEDESINNPTRMLKVYRGPWTEERAKYWTFTDTADEYVNAQKTIHGFYDFKDQEWSYTLAHVPRDAVIEVQANKQDVSPRLLESAATGISLTSQTTAFERSSTARSETEGVHETPLPVIAASYSLPKAMIAVIQLCFAVSTLYQSRGDQIIYYGYVAFGVTVIPYALMSFVNLLGNMLTPDYHALYLVGSDVMDEAIRRGARFDGVVGRLVQDISPSTAVAEALQSLDEGEKEGTVTFSYRDKHSCNEFPATLIDYSTPASLSLLRRRKIVGEVIESTYRDLSPSIFVPSHSKFLRHRHYDYPTDMNSTQMTHQGSFSLSSMAFSGWRTLVTFVNAGIVFGLIGAVTKFHSGVASIGQINWIQHWWIFGTVYSGYGIEDAITNMRLPEPDMGPPSKFWDLLLAAPLLLFGIPAIGGFVVVSQMLFIYGTCSTI